MSGTILTSEDQYFEFENPEKHFYSIFEIAHALSNLCRFTGHVREFYSVAQHSVYVSLLCPPELAMCGLLHDASEAYLGDVASPLKRMLCDYKVIEKQVEEAICNFYKLPFPLPAEVKHADMQMLLTEKRDLLPNGYARAELWPSAEFPPMTHRICPMTPKEAERFFLFRFADLKRKEKMN